MSGATAFAPFRKAGPGPIEEKLALEDARPLLRCLGLGHLVGLGLATWILSVEVVIPESLAEGPSIITCGGAVFLPKAPAARQAESKEPPRVSKRKQAVAPPPLAGTPAPSMTPGALGQSVLTSRTDKVGLLAYDLLDRALKNIDEDKLARTEGLTRTSPTRLAGRRGKVSEAFDQGYLAGGTEDGTGDGVLPPGPGGGIPTALKTVEGPSGAPVDIDLAEEGLSRSAAAILAVVRAHSPGLRHLYNTHLKRMPGLGGKVTVRFAIAPGGRVVDAAIVSSTTGSRAFDEEVVGRILAWRFEPVKAFGTDLVTVPFNFSE